MVEITGIPGAVLTVVAIALYVLGRWRNWPAVFLLAGWGFAGGLDWWIERTPLSPNDLRLAFDEEAQAVEVFGEIEGPPDLRLSEYRGQIRPSTAISLQVRGWRQDGLPWQRIQGRVMTRTRGVAPAGIFQGQVVVVQGVLRRPPEAVAQGLFDYREHLRFRGISHLLEADSFVDWQVVADPPVRVPWSARFIPWAQRALSYGLPDDESTRLLWAMTLGWRTALTEQTVASFVEAGTMHVFAISGLHIALLAGVAVAVLRLARVSRPLCGAVVVPLTWMYVAATGWQPSAVRSAVMMTVVVGGWALRRPGDALNSLALAALAILVWSPGELFQPGFQLSFAAVAGLVLWASRWAAILQRILTPARDPFLPESSFPWWRTEMEFWLKALNQSLAVSAAALVATLPLTLHLFHLVSPVSLLANVVVVPLSGLALAANVGTLVTYGWFPGLAGLFNASAWLSMGGMIGLSRWFAGLPGAVWASASPPWGWWVAYYVWLMVPSFSGGEETMRRRLWWGTGLGLAGVALGLGWWSSRTATITLLPGAVVVVNEPGFRNDLVANSGGAVQVNRVLIPWLRAQGWNRMQTFLISRADAAHVGGATNLFAHWTPKEVITGPRRQRSPLFRQFLKCAADHNVPHREGAWGSQVGRWTVLGPEAGQAFRRAADNALVLAGTIGGVSVVLAPELGSEGLRALSERWPPELNDPELLIAGVSEGNARPLQQWIKRISPRWILLTRTSPVGSVRREQRLRRMDLGNSDRTVWLDPDRATALRLRGGNWELIGPDGERQVWKGITSR